VEIIPTLSPGIAVWDVNGDVQVVKHIVTEYERPLVYTDRAMTESSAAAAGEDDAGEDELPLAFIERKALPAGRANSRRPAGALMPAGGIGGDGSSGRSGGSSGSNGNSGGGGGRSIAADGSGGNGNNGDGGHGRHSGPPAPEDPDLTAIAAAVFGPRASNPSQAPK
jgi:hypothetical protein